MITPLHILQAVRTTLTLLTVLAALAVAIVATVSGLTRLTGLTGSTSVGHARRVVLAPPVPSSPIVGRATCGETGWLLNRALQLIEVKPAAGLAAIHQIRGLEPSARPRGLACVSDDTLWTLETPHVLTRLAPDGRVGERVELLLPRTALFAAGDRIVFHQLPTIAAAPLLASSIPRQPFEYRAWPGLTGRNGSDHEDLLKRNLMNCGIASGASLPCWFADEPRMTISNGTTIRTVPIRSLPATIDYAMPVWDAALVDSGALWVLISGIPTIEGRHAGEWLLRIDNDGLERVRFHLNPSARLIVSGNDTGCTLLTTGGDLMEIHVN